MKEGAENHISISYKSVREILKRRFHTIPRLYFPLILGEMEEMELIKKIGNKKNMVYELKGKDLHKQLNNLIASSII